MIKKGTGCFQTYSCDENMSTDFILERKTYEGLYISDVERVVKDEEMFIKNAKDVFDKLNERNVPLQIIRKYQDEHSIVVGLNKLKVLKTHCYITIVSDMENFKETGLIWFDDGSRDARESLSNIIDEVDWEKAEEWEF